MRGAVNFLPSHRRGLPESARRIALAAGFALCLTAAFAVGEEATPALDVHPTPSSAWIPIENGAASGQDLPEYLQAVQFVPASRNFLGQNVSVLRLRFTDAAPEGEELLLKLVFQDRADGRPVVSAWDEIGNEIARSNPLGNGTNLPASETVIVPIEGANYIEIEIPGDGANLYGAFVSLVDTKMVREAADFAEVKPWDEPFHGQVPVPPVRNDRLLYGTVSATILNETVQLDSEQSSSLALEFDLERKPLAALVTFEVLNASIESPLLLACNRTPVGEAAYQLPDLADPAYRGLVRPLVQGMRFHYAGWIRAQKLISGANLQIGTNELLIQLPKGVDPAAVRSVTVQLKYLWEKLDYEIRP